MEIPVRGYLRYHICQLLRGSYDLFCGSFPKGGFQNVAFFSFGLLCQAKGSVTASECGYHTVQKKGGGGSENRAPLELAHSLFRGFCRQPPRVFETLS